MVSFERTKMKDWGVIKVTSEEWSTIKSLMQHVAQPEVFHDSEMDVMSGLEHEDWLLWNKKYSDDEYKDSPPKIIHRSALRVLFTTANNAEDAKIQGLTKEHKEIIEELLRHSISDAVECN